MREGFLVVALTWLLDAVAVSLPYVFSSEVQLDHPVDGLFEAMSGMTTTGATVLVDYDSVDRSIMLWRQFSQVDRRHGHRRPRSAPSCRACASGGAS